MARRIDDELRADGSVILAAVDRDAPWHEAHEAGDPPIVLFVDQRRYRAVSGGILEKDTRKIAAIRFDARRVRQSKRRPVHRRDLRDVASDEGPNARRLSRDRRRGDHSGDRHRRATVANTSRAAFVNAPAASRAAWAARVHCDAAFSE